MKKHLLTALYAGLFAVSAHAAPGEYWEVSTKVEMAGMPMAIPGMTVKVCVPTGSEKNPQAMQPKDNKCKMSDVKTSGNKVSWKVTCVEHGGTMTGTGESTHDRDSFHGTMHMKGNTSDQTIDMTQNYNGKKIGGACDSEAQGREIKKMVGEMCDSSTFTATDWIARADLFLKGSSCPGKKAPLCAAVRRDAARDTDAYQMLINTEMNNNGLISGACGINLEATRAAVCKANKDGDYSFLKANCPAEAKAYKEMARSKNCEGRGYTARNSAGCQDGAAGDDAAENMAEETSQARAKPTAGKSSKASKEADDSQHKDAGKMLDKIPATGNVNTDAIVEGAKKLKGLFGF